MGLQWNVNLEFRFVLVKLIGVTVTYGGSINGLTSMRLTQVRRVNVPPSGGGASSLFTLRNISHISPLAT
jgi:hypothetical protein